MDYKKFFSSSIDTLKKSGEYRIFRDIGRLAGSFPTATGNFARVVGYALSGSNQNDGQDIIYFNPDNTWIEIA